MSERIPGDGAEEVTQPTKQDAVESNEKPVIMQEPTVPDSAGDAQPDSTAGTSDTGDTQAASDTSQNTVTDSKESKAPGKCEYILEYIVLQMCKE